MRLRWLPVCWVLAALSLGGCANRQDVLITKLRGQAVGQVYPVTVDQAWRISKTIFRLEPTDAVEEHPAENYLLTSQNAGPLSPATYLGVFIEPAQGAAQTTVTFVARRRSPVQSYPALSEATFHKKFAELVALVSTIGPTHDGKSNDAGAHAD